MTRLCIKRKRGVYGELVRYVEVSGTRYYVVRANTVGVGKSWILSWGYSLTLDSMVLVGEQYHFHTQADLLYYLEADVLAGKL